MRLIAAPSNQGLQALKPGHTPGAWRGPEALIGAGLIEAVRPRLIDVLDKPSWSAAPQAGTSLLNGPALRAFNLELAARVRAAVRDKAFALVVGGDCSVLPGALAGASARGPLRLIHIDGHSDFRHPGNTPAASAPFAAAGMDLALVTGRGEPLMTTWPDAPTPLVEDRHVLQLGERENRDPDYPWGDIAETDINRIDVFDALDSGAPAVRDRILRMIEDEPDLGFWVHLDIDVLDQAFMPAVDSPGSPGLRPDDLRIILSALVEDDRCRGMTLTIYDPDLDPDGRCAALIVALLASLPFPR